MKTRYFITALLLSLFLSVSARSFVEGEKIYLDANQGWHDGEFDWSSSGAHIYLYIWNNSTTRWVEMTRENGNIFSGSMPAGNWDKVIVVRKQYSGANWDNVWNQTCNLPIVDNQSVNLIFQFWKRNDGNDCNGSANWQTYAPQPSKIPDYNTLKAQVEAGGVSAEEIHICPSALGGPFSLRCKLNASRTEYIYDDVQCHSWYISKNGTTWTSVDGYGGNIRNGEFDKDIISNTLPASGSPIYYYLHSAKPSGRRLIKIMTDAPECDLTCAITSFETAISAVNADDNTYTLDGMVAFGKASGSLVVECDGKSITIDNPKSPQSFSLHGVPASTTDGKTTTATAYFTAGEGCAKTITIPVPNSRQALEKIYKDVLTGETATLVPQDADPDNDYVWIVDGVEYHKTAGQAQNFTTQTYDHDYSMTYVYKEYYPISGNTDDLISNGSYELATGYGNMGEQSTISDYNFWGYYTKTQDSQLNFYTDETINPCVQWDGGNCKHRQYEENGFAVVRNAHNFFPTYVSVVPRDDDAGHNFALFDAATGAEGGNKRAWHAKTTQGIKEGTTYVFSFWAANINNYGEMDNAAKLQFRIKYNGKTKDLGDVLDLNSDEYRNNIWHQRSATFYADEDAEDVEISVVNLNTNTLNTGNDFALDDIQFHAISSVSRVVKSHQVFTVYFHEPKIKEFTATPVQMNCGVESYKVKLHVKYANPKGNLVIVDNNTGREYFNGEVEGYGIYTEEHQEIDFDKDDIEIEIDGLTGKKYRLRAYFSDWQPAQAIATFNDPVLPLFTATDDNNPDAVLDCNAIAYTLNGVVDYTNMNGNASVWVDNNIGMKEYQVVLNDAAANSFEYSVDRIPADGQQHTLHIEFAGRGATCPLERDFIAPFSPRVEIPVISVPAMLPCSATEYEVEVVVTTQYDATGRKLVLTYEDNGQEQTTTVDATGLRTTVKLTLHNFAPDNALTVLPMLPMYAALEHSPMCKAETEYVLPHFNAILPDFEVNVSPVKCGDTEYTVSGTVSFGMADGDLVVEYDEDHRDVIAVRAGSTSAEFSIRGIELDDSGEDLNLNAYFMGSPQCVATSQVFKSPVVPTLSAHYDISEMLVCNDKTYTIDVTVEAENQTGSMTITDHNLTTGESRNYTTSSFTLPRPEQNEEHEITVSFGGSNDCSYTIPQRFITTPDVPVVREFKIDETELPCDGSTIYNQPFTLIALNQVGKMVVMLDGSEVTDNVIDKGNGKYEIIGVDASVLEHTVNVMWNRGMCVVSATFNSPAIPSLDVVAQEIGIGCDERTYVQPFDIIYVYQKGEMTIQVDNMPAQNVDFIAADREEQNVTVEIELAADGQTHQVSVTTTEGCQVINQEFTAAQSPVIGSITVTDVPDHMSCGQKSYSATLNIQTYNADGQQILVNYNNGLSDKEELINVTGNDALLTQTLTLYNSNSGRQTIGVQYEGFDCDIHEVQYLTPTLSTINSGFAVEVSSTPCGAMEYAISGTLEFDMADGDLVVEFDDSHRDVVSVPDGATSANFHIDGMTAIGDNLTLNAYFMANPQCSATSREFKSPVVPSLSITADEVSVGCDNVSYAQSFTITYVNQRGAMTFWVDTQRRQSVQYVEGDGNELTVQMSATIPADGKTHHVSVTVDDGCSILDQEFTAAHSPVITQAPLLVDVPDKIPCSQTQYDARLIVYSANYEGTSLIISNDAGPLTVAPVPVTSSEMEIPLTLTDINKGYVNIFITFDGFACHNVIGYKTPSYASITPDFEVSRSETDCGVMDYSVSGTIEFDMADGDLVVEFDDEHTQTIQIPEGATSAKFEIEHMDAVGNDLLLNAYFTGSPECGVQSKQFQSPVQPSIAVNPKVQSIQCGSLTYQQYFTISYVYQRSNMEFWVDDQEHIIIDDFTPRYSDVLTKEVFVTIPADGQTHYINMTAGNGCHIDKQEFKALQSPVILEISKIEIPEYINCGQKSYNLQFVVETANYLGKNLVIEYNDGLGDKTETIGITDDNTPISLTLCNQNTTDNTIQIYFEGGYACVAEIRYNAPIVASINSGYEVVAGPTACGILDYSVSGTVEFDIAAGDIVVQYDEGHRDVIPYSELVGKTSADFQIDHIQAEGDDLRLLAWFSIDGQQIMCEARSAEFASPAVPSLTATLSVDSLIVCGDKSYNINVAVDAQHQTGTMKVTDHNLTTGGTTDYATTEFTLLRPTSVEVHEIIVSYDGEGDCQYTIPNKFTITPTVPTLGSLTAEPVAMACGEDMFALNLTLEFENPSGQLVITDNGVTLYEGAPTQSPFKLTTDKLVTPTGVKHNIDVQFGICQQTFTDAYNEPVKPDCNMFNATLCHGESYVANGFNVPTPAVGEYKIALAVNNASVLTPQNRLDSLTLTVKAQPDVEVQGGAVYCSTESNFDIPFSVTAGEPDIFTVLVDGENKTISRDDTHIILPSDGIKPGEHTIILTVGESGLTCQTERQFKILVADGTLMYSKWQDVLFIDNHEDRFVAYQWYRNGESLAGEILQRLYLPNWPAGSYYCRMTTTTGEQIYTCAQEFGDVQRSADAVEQRLQIGVTPTQVRALMPVTITITGDNVQDTEYDVKVFDVTGKEVDTYRLSGSVNNIVAPQQSGMFIIRVETATQRHTQKIIVY